MKCSPKFLPVSLPFCHPLAKRTLAASGNTYDPGKQPSCLPGAWLPSSVLDTSCQAFL